MKCSKCGIEVPSSYLKCPSCGQGFHGLSSSSSFKEETSLQPTVDSNDSQNKLNPILRGSVTGIGGWLILAAIFIPISIINVLFSSINSLKALEPGVWDSLTTPGLSTFIPYFSEFFIFEMILNASIIILLLYAAFLFYRKSARLPKFFILMLAYSFLAQIADFTAASAILPTDVSYRHMLQALVPLIVWGLYFTKSKRVKNTFVN